MEGADKKIIDGAVGPIGARHGVVVRPPIIIKMIKGAKEIRHKQRDQIDRREGTNRGDAERKAWPVRVGKKLHGQERRHAQNREDEHGTRRQNASPARR